MSTTLTRLNHRSEPANTAETDPCLAPAVSGTYKQNDEEENAVTVRRQDYTISYYPNRIVLSGAYPSIREEAARIVDKFSFSAQPYRIQSETADSIVIVPRPTSVLL